MENQGTVYLIRLDEKLSRAQYYSGFTTQHPIDRLEEHRKGRGSKMLAAANAKGIEYHIVRVWENEDRNFERKLKNRRNHKKLCPIFTKKKELRYKYIKR